jgi:tetratricopeptide (TPR) repeat protein
VKNLILFSMLGLLACASPQVKEAGPGDISDASFKREAPLKSNEVADFYTEGTKTLNPALQDETLDRYSAKELAQFKDSADPLVAIAVRCHRGEFKPALELASKSFDRYHKVAPYWNQVANCHLHQKSYRKALLFYNKALEVSPDYVPALNNIGVLYSRQRQDQKALVAFERANRQSKFSKTPRYNLAQLYLSYGLAESALPLFQGLLNLALDDVDMLNAVASCFYLTGNYREAASHYQRIPQGQWSRPEIGINMAVTMHKLGRQADAMKIFAGVDRPQSEELKSYHSLVSTRLGDKP